MPGSPQATPEGAESGGPQELLKPPHILSLSQKRAKAQAAGSRELAWQGREGDADVSGLTEGFRAGGPLFPASPLLLERKSMGEVGQG